MKKTSFVLVLGVATLALNCVTAYAGQLDSIPAADQAKERSVAPYKSPVINLEWQLAPYYVMSEDASLKELLGVKHEFPGAFSTMLTREQVESLNNMGIGTEAVRLYQIKGKPVCGDGVCQGNEPKTCPEDCQAGPEPEPSCSPDSQKPWGILEVNGGAGGDGVTVAVLDTGVDTDHPDLAGNIVDCISMVTHFKPDMDNCEDKSGHGTHVAGTVLANGGPDGSGIYGVAPSANLMVVKVCDKRGFCYGDDVAAGILYSAERGADIISMSFGGDSPDPFVIAAIDEAVDWGVLPIAAAGNDGPADGSIDYPAAYVKVIAVGAIDGTGSVPYWSSRGLNDGDSTVEEKEVEFAAPGVSIESTYNNGCYAYMSGTSMATPHISGLAAKLWRDAWNTRNDLQAIAQDVPPSGDDRASGFGLPVAP